MPLTITVPEFEGFDNKKQEFITTKETVLRLEHSLVSISKWESKWHISFLHEQQEGHLTKEHLMDYIRCMTLTQNVDPNVYLGITKNNFKAIVDYITDPMTATTFAKVEGQGPSFKIITSEVIYGWMVGLQIPFECEKWHVNRLLTLIRVCNENNKPDKKMKPADAMATHRALNASRRAARKKH